MSVIPQLWRFTAISSPNCSITFSCPTVASCGHHAPTRIVVAQSESKTTVSLTEAKIANGPRKIGRKPNDCLECESLVVIGSFKSSLSKCNRLVVQEKFCMGWRELHSSNLWQRVRISVPSRLFFRRHHFRE